MAFCVFCSLRTDPKHHRKKYEAVLFDEMVSICQQPFLQCSECGAGAGQKCLKAALSLMDGPVLFRSLLIQKELCQPDWYFTDIVIYAILNCIYNC